MSRTASGPADVATAEPRSPASPSSPSRPPRTTDAAAYGSCEEPCPPSPRPDTDTPSTATAAASEVLLPPRCRNAGTGSPPATSTRTGTDGRRPHRESDAGTRGWCEGSPVWPRLKVSGVNRISMSEVLGQGQLRGGRRFLLDLVTCSRWEGVWTVLVPRPRRQGAPLDLRPHVRGAPSRTGRAAPLRPPGLRPTGPPRRWHAVREHERHEGAWQGVLRRAALEREGEQRRRAGDSPPVCRGRLDTIRARLPVQDQPVPSQSDRDPKQVGGSTRPCHLLG